MQSQEQIIKFHDDFKRIEFINYHDCIDLLGALIYLRYGASETDLLGRSDQYRWENQLPELHPIGTLSDFYRVEDILADEYREVFNWLIRVANKNRVKCTCDLLVAYGESENPENALVALSDRVLSIGSNEGPMHFDYVKTVKGVVLNPFFWRFADKMIGVGGSLGDQWAALSRKLHAIKRVNIGVLDLQKPKFRIATDNLGSLKYHAYNDERALIDLWPQQGWTSIQALEIRSDFRFFMPSLAEAKKAAIQEGTFPNLGTLSSSDPQEPHPTTESVPNQETDQSATSGKRRGRPPKYDWQAFMVEVVRTANTPDGLPERQVDLENIMLQWCQDKWGVQPSTSTIREKISPCYLDI